MDLGEGESQGGHSQEGGGDGSRICHQIVGPLLSGKRQHGSPQFCAHSIAGAELTGPTAAAIAPHEVREHFFPYPQETSGCFLGPTAVAILVPL